MVDAADAEKVFLSSDVLGIDGRAAKLVGYGIVTNGTYQDTGCEPQYWSYGLFPNWATCCGAAIGGRSLIFSGPVGAWRSSACPWPSPMVSWTT